MASKLNRAAILRHAWEYARSWRHHYAAVEFNDQFNRWGHPRKGATVRGFDEIYAATPVPLGAAMRRAWAEAKESSELRNARGALMAAQAIDCTAAAIPQIAAAEKRIAQLLAA